MSATLPIAVYVHWPYCARICPYCDFNVVRDRGQAEQGALAQAIMADLKAHAERIGPRTLVSVFLGGGTPSLMKPVWAAEIIATARDLWPAVSPIEVTLEANPTDAEAAHFAAFAGAGVNRLSLGVQSLNDQSLRFLGRNHDAAEAIRAIGLAADAFPHLSLDLIYALPGQTIVDWTEELKTAVAFGAEHISPYQLTIETGTAFHRAVTRGAWAPPHEGRGADLYDATQMVLSESGFTAYEVSNYARGDTARSRHNLAYWRGEDYVGVGPGAHGRLTLDGARVATEAGQAVGAYIAAVTKNGVGWSSFERLSPRETAEERLLMGLRCNEGVPWEDLAALHLGDDALADFMAHGLITITDGRLIATQRGRLMLDRLSAEIATAGRALEPA